MAISPSVEKVLKQVEAVSGMPVHIEPSSSLPQNILAKATMARGGIPFHMVEYQAKASGAPDYLIVYQCGFILRRYAVAAINRMTSRQRLMAKTPFATGYRRISRSHDPMRVQPASSNSSIPVS